MKKSLSILCILASCITFIGCTNTIVMPPKGGASLGLKKPLWINGTKFDNLLYSKNLPAISKHETLSVANAGFWLGNTNNKVSQLAYFFELNIKKPFFQEKVYTRAILENPSNPDKPIVYEHYLTQSEKSTRVRHSPLEQIKMNKTYHFSFEFYSDAERKNLITKIDQAITSVVDNTSGCVKLSDEYMTQIFGTILDPNGQPIPLNKLMIECHKDK